jgi:bacterioferritin-associated ferredoxin
MFVCLCTGITTQVIDDVVAAGASTTKEIATACGAGGECGRCRRTLRAILAAHEELGGEVDGKGLRRRISDTFRRQARPHHGLDEQT